MRLTALNEFYGATRDARKLIVVDLGFLGDSLHLVPALWELRAQYPRAELHVLSSPLGAEVVRLAPCVDRVWALELVPAKRSWGEQGRMVRALRRERFDVAFNFSGNDRTIIMTALTGARWRAAHAAGREHFWNPWLIPNWVPRRAANLAVFEQRRQVLAALGVPLTAPRFDLRIATEAAAWAAGLVKSGTVHLSLNSANPLKEWPVTNYAALVQRLAREFPGLPLAVSAMAKEREQARVREFLAAAPGVDVTVLPADMSIGQLAAVIQRCRLHFGPDSGVMHLAVALGVPTVSLFREQGNFREWLPALPGHDVLLAPCPCVDHHDAPCEATGQARCLAAITVDTVAERIAGRLRK